MQQSNRAVGKCKGMQGIACGVAGVGEEEKQMGKGKEQRKEGRNDKSVE